MIARAKPCQLVSPAATRCHVPDAGTPWATIRALASAIHAADVGAPIWSATTRSSSRSLAKRSMVSRKFLPCPAYTQAVRRIAWRAPLARIASSPASLLAP